MLLGLGFPDKFIDWIMIRLTSPKFSLVINGCPNGYFASKRGLRQGDPMSPLLFVICMEYLSRILHKLREDSEFQFHPRCKGMKLTHMCFADDLILCCKGEFKSISLLLQCFKLFSDSSGLQANVSKTDIYCYGMGDQEVQRVLEFSGFKRGFLPFKYLGVPICSKRISACQCENLIDKMTARIKIWSSRNLSYAARVQLINSVLLSIHMYWAQVFVLPKSVLQGIERICRAFLWSGNFQCTAPGLVAWDNLCRRRNEGGLGFHELKTWNLALMGKYVWSVATKQDNLWVKWIHSVYIHNQDWASYSPPVDSSWYWKSICRIKQTFLQHMSMADIQTIQHYSVKKAYLAFYPCGSKVFWPQYVWSRLVVPKFRFCAWLAIQDRLKTRERLKKFSLCEDASCLLCGGVGETQGHLFFDCHYSCKVWEAIRAWLQITPCRVKLLDFLNWLDRRFRGSRTRKAVVGSAICATIYFIWKERNNALWNARISTIDHVISCIKFNVKHRICASLPRKCARADRAWVMSL